LASTPSTVKIERLTSKHVDAALQAAHESVEDIYPWMEWCRPGLERSEVAAMVAALEDAWDKGVAYTFVVIDSATGEFLGSVGLNRIDQRSRFANLNYWIRSSKKGRGIATQASELACRYGIEKLGLARIGILVAEGNTASQRVAERLGATREGILRNAIRLHDRQMNATQYSIIPSDLDNLVAG
jgi:ribosomal-protein-serine acetyltransferase